MWTAVVSGSKRTGQPLGPNTPVPSKVSNIARLSLPGTSEALHSPQHHAEIVRLPAGHHPGHLLLVTCKVVAAVTNLPAQHGRPDRRDVRARQGVGTNKLDRRSGQRMGPGCGWLIDAGRDIPAYREFIIAPYLHDIISVLRESRLPDIETRAIGFEAALAGGVPDWGLRRRSKAIGCAV
jgi:hypothetical protein